ncbi:hypothetical protein [Algivirga pacifica]|uniref:Uncharacterized protein n=1 Tax=Algivirga pacifica TaxID=1162670 RepID=A0ABP9DJW6_9BACT
MLYLEISSPYNQETLIIEEDQKSIWAYLLDHKQGIIMDGFLCSTGTLVNSQQEIKAAIDRGLAPPLQTKFKNNHSIQTNLSEKIISVDWYSPNQILIYINDILYLKMLSDEQVSYSLAVNQDGPYGKQLI